MANASGPIESIVINGRRFTSDGDDSCTVTYNGFNNEIKPNGDGTMRMLKSRHAGSIGGLNIVIRHERNDMEFLKETQDGMDFVAVSATLVDGTVLSGNMQLTDAVELDTKEGTASITLEGVLEKL